MLRVLWILSLASLTIGDQKPPSDELYKAFEELASSDQPLESSLPGCPVLDPESSDYESSSENQCEYDDSNCHPDSSTTSEACPVAKPVTRDDFGKWGKPPPDEFYKALEALASSDQPLESSLPESPAPDSESSDYESSSENQCEYDDSNCHPDSSTSKANPVDKPGIRDDLKHGLDIELGLPFQRMYVGGSTRGIPGEDFPNFVDFPATSFSCSDQEWVPGFYADVESRCQVYHACWTDRQDSFLCPVGKIYNQQVLTCDHWYNSKCSLAPHYYNVNKDLELISTEGITKEEVERFILTDPARMALIAQYLPVKTKISIFPKTSDSKSKTFAKRTARHISTTESRYFAQQPQSTTEATVTEEVQHSTQSPDCPEIIKYINVEAAVKLIFDRLDNLVKNIIREGKEYKAASDAKKSCSTAHADEKPVDSRIKRSRPTISPLTKTALIKNYIKLLKLRKS